jgi:hypothetical protein
MKRFAERVAVLQRDDFHLDAISGQCLAQGGHAVGRSTKLGRKAADGEDYSQRQKQKLKAEIGNN